MSTRLPTNRYSAEVALSLVVGDETIGLSQVAPDFVILAEQIELPPCPAEVHVSVDGHLHCRQVFLVEGAFPSNVRTRISERL